MYNDVDESQLLVDKDSNHPRIYYKTWRARFFIVTSLMVCFSAGLIACLTVFLMEAAAKNDKACQVPPSSESVQDQYLNAAVASDAVPCAAISSNLMAIQKASAVDAAIAGIICSCVVNFHSCGIAGGGFMNIYIRSERKSYTVDMREVAPAAASENMYVKNRDGSKYGGVSVGTFGAVSSLYEVHKKLGGSPSSVSWENLLQPSIDLAKLGFSVTSSMEVATKKFFKDPRRDQFPVLRYLLTDPATNAHVKAGDILRNPQLADTLTILAADPYALSNGSLLDIAVKEIQDGGGILTTEDLRNYRARWREPLKVQLQALDQVLYTLPPPSSGVLIALTLNVLDEYQWQLPVMDDCDKVSLFLHRFVETMKFAYASRSRLGDEDFVNVTAILANLTSDSYAKYVSSRITDDRTHPVSYYDPDFGDSFDQGTSHFSLLGPNGDAVSATFSINLYFGSKLMGNTTGILYNNEMDDFSTPNTSNAYNLPPSPLNFIRPGKRPMSSMSPIIVTDRSGDVISVAGASGGSLIISSVALVTSLSSIFNQTIKFAIDYPRVHHQLVPDVVYVQKTLPKEIIRQLKDRGHKVKYSSSISVVQGIRRPKSSSKGAIECNCDYRKLGLCSGF